HRVRVRPRGDSLRHRCRVPRTRPAARGAAGAHALAQRRSHARRDAGAAGSADGSGPRLAVTAPAPRVGVIGAGVTGLAAAWEVARSGGQPVVLESEQRAGGVIVTEHREGFVVEGGPDGFLAAEAELPALAVELGIGDRVVDQRARGTSLWTGTALTPVEDGRAAAVLGIEAKSAEVAAGFR